MTDRDFIKTFENCEISKEAWKHKDHIRRKLTAKFLSASLLLVLIFLINGAEFFDSSSWRRPAFAALLVITLITRSWDAFGCALILFLMYFYGLIVPQSLKYVPILGFLVPFLVASVTLYSIPQTRNYFGWLRKGGADRTTLMLVLATGLLSTAALAAWAFWTNNLGIGSQMVNSVGSIPKWMLFLIILPVFALTNAFAEEVVFRGLIQESLSRTFNVPLTIFLQASAFAAVHYGAGFPNGLVGYGMVLVYGAMLGYLRFRTKGILAPYIAHAIADTTIACLLAYLVLK